MDAVTNSDPKLLYYACHRFVPVDRALELYFSGCEFYCEGCQNQSLWNRDGARLVDADEILQEVEIYKDIAKRVDILGGEPTLQYQHQMAKLCAGLKRLGFQNLVYFTGNNYNESVLHIPGIWRPEWEWCDYLKYGSYDASKEPYTEPLLGLRLAGTNQKLIKLH